MTITGKTLVVTDQTSALDLMKFVDTGSETGRTKLVAQKNEDNTITLYFKDDKRSSFKERFNGDAKQRRQDATEALTSVMNRVMDNLKSKAPRPEMIEYAQGWFAHRLDEAKGKAMRVDEAKTMMKGLADLEMMSQILKPIPPKPQERPEAPKTLEDLPKKLQIAPKDKKSFDTSEGKLELSTFELNGKTYQPKKELAKGSFGLVVRYETDDKPPQQLAVKVLGTKPGPKDGQKLEEEALSHGRVSGGDDHHPNLLGMKGAMRMHNGTPAIILDLAPGGSLLDAGRNIAVLKGDGEGQVPDNLGKVIAATLLKDVAEGMSHLHGEGYVHNDLKDVNVLIDDKGRAVIMDFGDASPTDTNSFGKLAGVNPSYASSEIVAIKKQGGDYNDKFQKDVYKVKEQVFSSLDGMAFMGEAIKTELKEDFEQALTDIKEHQVSQTKELIQTEGFKPLGNDLWGLGTIALALFGNDHIGTHEDPKSKGWAPIQERVVHHSKVFGTIDDKTGILEKSALVTSTGDKEADKLIEAQFSKDSDKRLSSSSVAESPAVNRPGVGGNAVREFISIMQEVGDLRNKMNEAQKTMDEIIRNSPTKELDQLSSETYKKSEEIFNKANEELQSILGDFEEKKTKALEEISPTKKNAKVDTVIVDQNDDKSEIDTN